MKRITSVVILCIFSFALWIGLWEVRQVYGGEPPCNYQITGPKIIGQLTLVKLWDDQGEELLSTNVTFRGMCKREIVKIKICGFPLSELNSFDEITKENLTGYILLYGGPPDCKSECGLEDIVIDRVLSFHKQPDKIIAHVVFMYLECLPGPITSTPKSKVKTKK